MLLEAGSRLGPYEITSRIGAGGMGEVYRARDTRLDRTVAIKVLPGHVAADPERRSRFEREARAIAKLNHPNILAIHDVGEEDGVRFIVTELVDGEPVRGPQPVRKLLDLAAQIADGLAAAHEAGIVHRDIKPDNILIARDGRPKILDFGLAREDAQASGGSGVTQTVTSAGTVLGTVAYMSPEQARAGLADARSDQFSFGLVLYELASGRRAFVRDSAAQTLTAIIEAEPDLAPVSQVPAPLRWIIERCLSKDPAGRYASTSDLYRDLRQLRDRQSELSQSGARDVLAPPPRRRGPWQVLGGAVLVAALAGVTFWPRGGSESALDDYRFTPFAVDAGVQSMPAWSPDGQSLAYSGEVDGYAQVFVRRLDQPAASQITDLPGDCTFPIWDSTGRRIFFVLARPDGSGFLGDDSEVWVVSAAGGAPERLIEHAPAFAVAPDGNTLAFVAPRDDGPGFVLRAFDLQARTTRDLISTMPSSANWRPSSRMLGFARDGSALGVLVPGTPELVVFTNFRDGGIEPRRVRFATATGEPVSLYAFDWMPDGRHVLLNLLDPFGGDRSTWLGDLESGVATRLTASTGWEFSPVVSPDGRRVAFSTTALDWDLIEVDLADQTHRQLVSSSRYDGWGDWLPDGSGFIFTTQRAGRPEIWSQSSRGGPPGPVVTPDAFADEATLFLSAGAVSPDGRSVAYVRFSPNAVRIYVSALAGSRPVPLTAEERLSVREDSPAWSPDGRWIVFRRGNQLMKALASGSTAPTLLAEDAAGNFSGGPQWLPDGLTVIYKATDGFRQIPADGGAARLVSDAKPAVWDVSADGRLIYAIIEGQRRAIDLHVIDIESGETRRLTSLGRAPLTPEFNGWYDSLRAMRLSPDGRQLMYAYLNPEADIWILEGIGTRGR